MVRLRIDNEFSMVNEETGEVFCRPEVKPFDLSKYANGRIHEFKTIGECRDFVNDCDVEFTEDYESRFSRWKWEELNLDLLFDYNYDDMLVLSIYSTEEYYD